MSASERQPSKLNKSLVINAGFGAGAVVMLALIVGGVIWYTSRPRSWNATAIQASFSQEAYSVDGDSNVIGTNLDYTVNNTTANDYTISGTDTFMIVEPDAMHPSASGKYKIGEPCFVPAGHKVKCSVSVDPEFDTSFAIEGFVIFDKVNRYKIVFPKPLRPSPEERKKAVADIKNQRPGR
jgi:hypothetical protein